MMMMIVIIIMTMIIVISRRCWETMDQKAVQYISAPCSLITLLFLLSFLKLLWLLRWREEGLEVGGARGGGGINNVVELLAADSLTSVSSNNGTRQQKIA